MRRGRCPPPRARGAGPRSPRGRRPSARRRRRRPPTGRCASCGLLRSPGLPLPRVPRSVL
ncbi:hypothetical protein FNX48_016245 [Streptomyces sp. IF17]|nr:hypothetical protein [Streptomyces alkaliphilus]